MAYNGRTGKNFQNGGSRMAGKRQCFISEQCYKSFTQNIQKVC